MSKNNANMAKGGLRRKLNAIKEFLTPLKSSQQSTGYDFHLGPTLEPYSTQRSQMAQTARIASRDSRFEPVPSDGEVDKINRDRLEQAKLSQAYEEMAQSREAQDLSLKSQHKLLIATLITALVALISAVTAIAISLNNKPPIVNVESPSVSVKPPDVTVKPNVIINMGRQQ